MAVWWWSAGTLLGMLLFYALIRSGWSRRRADPSLTVPQMVFALASGAVASDADRVIYPGASAAAWGTTPTACAGRLRATAASA